MQTFLLILTGIGAGILSGLFGIGGGIVIVPILVFGFGFKQQVASATSLVALLLPVGILGVMEYYKSGVIGWSEVQSGLFIAVGLVAGVLLGSRLSLSLPEDVVRKAFAVFLALVAARLFFQK